MLKKFAPFLFAALLTLAPVQSAAAWEEVCVNFPLGKTWFIAHFSVVHSYSFKTKGMPGIIPARDKRRHFTAPAHTIKNRRARARTATHSGSFGANGSRCVDISHIPNGGGFAVYVVTAHSEERAHCATPKSNPNMWMRQNTRSPNRKIWWQAYGIDSSPRCYFWRETG